VAEILTKQMKGKVRLEDAGFNWNIVDENIRDLEDIVTQVDKDAFSMSGQKCSALRLLLVDEKLLEKGILEKLAKKAGARRVGDWGVVPLLSITSNQMAERIEALLKVKSSSQVLEGKPQKDFPDMPEKYGLFSPAIVRIPVETLFNRDGQKLVFQEVFGPLLIVATYRKDQLDELLDSLEQIGHYLTAAVSSQDPQFVNYVLARTINGTTYAGRGRTTGAPPNHFFGPGNDPRGGALGTPKSAVDQWTCHREIILDFGERNEKDEPLPLT
jgi:1-pyrroline-5-carboxylate dehydrogenase